MWALAERIAAPAHTGDSTDAFKAALARAGIAVVPDTSTDPATAILEVPLTGTPSPVELLDFQAHALAVQAWGGAGWTGAELDSVMPLPSDAPTGTPSIAQLLAGYAARAVTPGGAFARALLAGQDLRDPATVRFPAVVLFLFAADLATDGGRIIAPSASPSAGVRLLPLAAAGPVVAAPAIDLTLLCSGPSGWIDAVAQDLCNLTLTLASETETACHATGHALAPVDMCGSGAGKTIPIAGLVPPLPLGGPTSVSGGTLTWSLSYENSVDLGFGGLSAEVQSTYTVRLQGP